MNNELHLDESTMKVSETDTKGSISSDQMIEEYSKLNDNITKTFNLVDSVVTASSEQALGIETINNSIQDLVKSNETILFEGKEDILREENRIKSEYKSLE